MTWTLPVKINPVSGIAPPSGDPVCALADRLEKPPRLKAAEATGAQAVNRSAAVTQFDMSMAMVIGPTPPGTGVMAAHFGATAS